MRKIFLHTLLVLGMAFSGAPVFAQGSKLTDLTELAEPPAPGDVSYIVDLSEQTAANRSKKITTFNLTRKHTKWVDSWEDFDTIGGESVYQIDPTEADTFYFDTTAIFSATTMTPVSGVTALMPQAESGVSNARITIVKADSGVTPVVVAGYTADGLTYQSIWVNIGTPATTNQSGTTDWEIDSQGDTKTYILCPDAESPVDVWLESKVISGT